MLATTAHYVQRLVLTFSVSRGLEQLSSKMWQSLAEAKLSLGLITFSFLLDRFFSLLNLRQKVSSLFLLELFLAVHLCDDLFCFSGFLLFLCNSYTRKI